MIIRDATEADVPEIQSIYAHHVLTGTGTFEEEPPSVEDMLARFRRIVDHGWRWLVATDETGVLGYGYYSQFRERTAYRYCLRTGKRAWPGSWQGAGAGAGGHLYRGRHAADDRRDR